MNKNSHGDADWLLNYLERALGDLVETIEVWDALTLDERLDVWAEWPLKEDKLAQLDQLARVDQLNTAQTRQYQALKERMTAQREALNRLPHAGQPVSQTT